MRTQIFNKISPELLGNDFEVVTERPDLIFVRSAKLHDLSLIPNTTRGIFRAGTGVDNIPVTELTKRGVPVFNTPGANANSVMELSLGMMIMASRNCFSAFDVANHSAPETDYEKLKSQFAGTEIAGKNILIIGLGNIGYSLAKACHNLGMTVSGYDPYISRDAEWLNKIDSLLNTPLNSFDFVSIHVPNNKETVGFVNQEFISGLKHGVIILNFAREKLVNSEALHLALESGQVRFYASDFVQENLKMHGPSKVLMLPHLGASTAEAELRAVQMAASQARDYWLFGEIRNSVNFPQLMTDREVGYRRLLLFNQNVPGVAAKITKTIHENGFNIAKTFNNSRNEISCFAFDLDCPGDHGIKRCTDLITALSDIKEIIRIRMISPSKI